LFALRQAPNRDSAYSPYELVYGKNVHTPLDLLYSGWRDQVEENFTLDELAKEKHDRAIEKRKEDYDKKAGRQEFKEGDLFLSRIPGMGKKLEDSWQDPFVVKLKLNDVNYRIGPAKGKGKLRIVHINNMKRYIE